MKYYIIAGEASGDLHASNLIRELRQKDPEAEFRAWGGDLMQEQGATLVKHIKELAFMGFVEVLLNLRTILRNIRLCKDDIAEWNPDVLILVDYPGFNLRIARWARKNGRKVFYYISPQIWAWKQNRAYKIKEDVEKMYVILPFEKDFYRRFDMEVDFVGHPLLDAVKQFRDQRMPTEAFRQTYGLSDKPIVALLPGSRKQEISKMLPLFAQMQDRFSDYQFVLAGAPSQTKEYYESVLGGKKIPIISGETYRLLMHAEAALVSSGTATLETALFNVPEVVCYKGGWLSYYIARMLVKVSYISLVNLIVDREIVKELIQGELNSKNLETELTAVLPGGNKRDQLLKDYEELREKLGGSGASEITASRMLKTLKG
ncbi:lipid-A-disaccharide synthase [bacterium SCSIO 12741]|nr:lipid-A-disaccharide synthase [bacterium SCSIO 12741]